MTMLTSSERGMGIFFSVMTSILVIMTVLYMHPDNFTETLKVLVLICLVGASNMLMTLWIMEQIKK